MRIKIGFAQFDVVPMDRAANLAIVRRVVAASSSADLLVLPELAVSGYDFIDAAEVESIAEPFGTGPTSESILQLAAQFRTTIVIGYPERAMEGLYNSCMLATPDGRLFNYRKLHLFSREKMFFLPGDAAPPVIDTPAGRIGLMICFDWFFPETARMLALNGAQIIAHPSNLVLSYCQRAMFARSVENRVFTVTANRIGAENRAGRSLAFTGSSQVVSPVGEYLVQAPVDSEHVGIIGINPHDADNKRITDANDLWEDRRTDIYRNPASGRTESP